MVHDAAAGRTPFSTAVSSGTISRRGLVRRQASGVLAASEHAGGADHQDRGDRDLPDVAPPVDSRGVGVEVEDVDVEPVAEEDAADAAQDRGPQRDVAVAGRDPLAQDPDDGATDERPEDGADHGGAPVAPRCCGLTSGQLRKPTCPATPVPISTYATFAPGTTILRPLLSVSAITPV